MNDFEKLEWVEVKAIEEMGKIYDQDGNEVTIDGDDDNCHYCDFNWRDIESAPKDGTWIVAIRPKCVFGRWDRVVIVCWSDDFKKWIWPDSQFDVYADDINETDDEGRYTYDPFQSDEFTHWMPLPQPPKESTE